MENILIIGLLVVILGAVCVYLWKARKKGVKCIGCPDGGNCSGSCSGNCGSCGGNCSCGHNHP